jgi:beta-galactosidase
MELSGIHKGYTDVHYIIDNVTLKDGKNVVKAVVQSDGKTYEDTIEWMYTGEKKREADSFSIKGVHAGFE